MAEIEFATPEQAEQAFYAAFENADLNAMMQVWADRAFIECIHPLADRVRGPRDVAESWMQIFSGGVRVRIRLSDIHRTQDALLAVHVVCEHLLFPGQTQARAPIIATNIYQLIDSSWRMVLHHASPASAENRKKQRSNVPETPPRGHLH